MVRRVLLLLWRLPRKTAAVLITGYQRTLSFDHGPLRVFYPYGFCRHHPTCSQYAKNVMLERGLVIGGLLTFRRLLTCTPWKTPPPERVLRVSGVLGKAKD